MGTFLKEPAFMKCFIRECEEITNSRCFQRLIVDWSVLLCSATEARIWFPLLWVQERLTELLQVPNLLLNLMQSFQIQLVCQVIGALAEGGRYQR